MCKLFVGYRLADGGPVVYAEGFCPAVGFGHGDALVKFLDVDVAALKQHFPSQMPSFCRACKMIVSSGVPPGNAI